MLSILEITTRIGCYVACAYCPQQKLVEAYRRRSPIVQMSLDTFERCLEKLPQDVLLIFCGMCEPWLNSFCTEMVLHAHRKGYPIAIETTLMGVTDSDIESLRPVSFEFIAVHLPSAQGYEKITVDDGYLARLAQIQKTLQAKKFYYHYYGETLHPRIDIPSARRISLHSRSKNIQIAGKSLPEKQKGLIRCERNLRWNVLLPNGDVTLCSMDYALQYVLGNLLLSDYDTLFGSEKYLEVEQGLRESASEVICRYCEAFARPVPKIL